MMRLGHGCRGPVDSRRRNFGSIITVAVQGKTGTRYREAKERPASLVWSICRLGERATPFHRVVQHGWSRDGAGTVSRILRKRDKENRGSCILDLYSPMAHPCLAQIHQPAEQGQWRENVASPCLALCRSVAFAWRAHPARLLSIASPHRTVRRLCRARILRLLSLCKCFGWVVDVASFGCSVQSDRRTLRVEKGQLSRLCV